MKEFFNFINFFIFPIIVSKEEFRSKSFKIFIGIIILIILVNIFYYI